MILTIFGETNYRDKTIANIFKNPRTYYNIIKDEFILRNYTIEGDARPEQVAYQIYGDPNLYWVILLLNDVIDPFHGFIRSMNTVQETIETRYQYVGGTEQVDHYVDELGREWFDVIENPVGSKNWYSLDQFGNPDRFVYRGVMVPYTVTEYEQDENEKLRTIQVIHPQDIQQFVDRMVNIIGELDGNS